MACPTCPGPRVPHHCRRVPSDFERLAASFQLGRRGAPLQLRRAVARPVEAEEWAPGPAILARRAKKSAAAAGRPECVTKAESAVADWEAADAFSATGASRPSLGASSEGDAESSIGTWELEGQGGLGPDQEDESIAISGLVAAVEEEAGAASATFSSASSASSVAAAGDLAEPACSSSISEASASTPRASPTVEALPMPSFPVYEASFPPPPPPASPAVVQEVFSDVRRVSLVSGSCPNCPGPRVPHRCGKAPTLQEQIMAMRQSSNLRRLGPSALRR
jgi:hypothetical protein